MTHEIQIASLIALLGLCVAYIFRIIANPPDMQLLRRIVELEKQVKELEECSAALQGLQDEIIALRGDNLRLMRIALTAASTARQGSFKEVANADPSTVEVWIAELNSARQNLARLEKQATTYGSNTPPELRQEIERTAQRVRSLEDQLDLYHALNTPDHAHHS